MMELPINGPSFALIESGQKVSETRLAKDPLPEEIQVGSQVVFINRDTQERAIRTITEVHHYQSSEDVVANEDLTKLGYQSAEVYLEKMHLFQTAEEEVTYGIIAFHFC